MLIHRCTRCGRLRMNRTAADDNVLRLLQLAALPLATPPLPYAGLAFAPDDEVRNGVAAGKRPGPDRASG